jgi:hypothetical protein
MNEDDINRVRSRALTYAPFLASELHLSVHTVWQFAHGFASLPDSTVRAMARRMQVEVTS